MGEHGAHAEEEEEQRDHSARTPPEAELGVLDMEHGRELDADIGEGDADRRWGK